ncbi:MAG TPA: LysR family transcriptional regulator [Roseiflexaceae bacterium]|nr:LysR family transcriptional regulator [Roseiflexaceae bacterium]
MDVDQLIAFDRIVREGSFSRAAWELHIAQPTISARIQSLEQAVGGPLFVRNSRRISLTALGASFLPYARRAIEVLAEGSAAAREAQDGQRGRLTIGVLGSLAGCFLPPALAQFQREHPRVECYIRAGSHQRMVDLLCDGVVELGLIAWPCIDPLSVELKPLLKISEPVVLAVPARHPLSQRTGVTIEEVARQADPLLLVRWWQSTHASVARVAARATAVANVPPETARALLLNGVGVGFFTRTQIADVLAAGHLCEVPVVDMAPITRDSALVRLARQREISVVAGEFAAVIREHATQLGVLM